MLRSYLAFAAGGNVVLRQSVLNQLGMGTTGVLYGGVCPIERTAILSPIPPAYWNSAYKIIIHSRETPGSLAAAAKGIASLGIGTVLAWASNESTQGHLSCTFITVIARELLERLNGIEGILAQLSQTVTERVSDLPAFRGPRLKAIRITPLSVLSAYGEQLDGCLWHRAALADHSLRLGATELLKVGPEVTLWQQVLEASNCTLSSTCIVSPDTEEGLLRVSPVPQSADLAKLGFRLGISSQRGLFTGYWQHALASIAKRSYSVYVANNLIVAKTENPPTEDAEFEFIVDRSASSEDLGVPLIQLREIWEARLVELFQTFAAERGDEATVADVSVSRPRGVGIPCFISTNARAGEGMWSRTAAEICHILQGHGFRPVTIDIASGAKDLRSQVRELVQACQFMVILHCPSRRVRLKRGPYISSEWVSFEEGVMAAGSGEIIRLRFENVRTPPYARDLVDVSIPRDGLHDQAKRELALRLEAWKEKIPRIYGTTGEGTDDIPEEILNRDCYEYFLGV